MSILIPGMEMPKNCLECPLCWEDEEGMNCCFTNVVCLNIGRQAACPLIELPTHGRLIDADALWEKEKSERALKKHRPKDQSIIFDAGFLAGFRAAAQIASKMPTILPADPEGGADG